MITNYTGVSGSRTAYLIARSIEQNKKALIVVSTGRAAARLGEDLAFFLPNSQILIMPEEEDLQVLYEARNREDQVSRIKAIQALCAPEKSEYVSVVISPVSAVMKYTETPDRFRSDIIDLELGSVYDPAELRRKLTEAGYSAAGSTEARGEFTARGGILDVFPPAYSHPIRIEFFDDEVDSIRFFDEDTQRSLENAMKVRIGPAAEFIPKVEERREALALIRKEYDRRIKRAKSEYVESNIADGRIERLEEHKGRITDAFEQESNVQIYSDFIDYFDIPKCRLWAYAESAPVIVVDPSRVEEAVPNDYKKEDWREIYGCKNVTVFTPFPEMIRGVDRLDNIHNVKSRQVAPFNGQIDLFAADIESLVKGGYLINIVSSSEERSERVREYLEIAELERGIHYKIGMLSSGFIMDDEKVCYIAESDIFPESHKKPRKSKAKKKSADSINFADLHKGDYIVHEAHGVGRFEGIKPITADGVTRDYLVIRYAGSDVLYIPTEQLDIIQKYIGNSGNAPALSKLSGGSWKRTRERAKKAIMEIAEDLVKLYAARKEMGGYAFGPDTLWQHEFEADFPYTETDDQLRATEEIKEDMQKPLPMDRLLCGDVGYGKTEVAARAIFKCISEGKQAALLAPTTLLVNQHYHNLKERFGNFPFEIREMSRFVSASEQKKVLQELKDGTIDLVIGTHRILSQDVKFKDLGLLVIDEEQRFGVRHKEKLKELRKNIDVLTLSATPIPRTLNMSLTGIKDISIIDEPPGERIPVHTYVTPYEDEVLRNAIERELARGGQVFVVTNRITGIQQIRERIEKLCPDAITTVGHGRMSEDTLENTMLDFVEGRANVLIATTIIENGIDIPNANTIIILNADKFGLSQLYQLRGRVGRSSRLAYAYLMYQPNRVLTEIARKRLAAIREFTEFGSGFKVAMRDLELRGAGNMLGEAQSGHIESIGYELYCKEIDRAVRQLKGEVVTEQRSDITIDLPIRAAIPPSYITDETLRLQAYRKIAGILSREDAEDVADELLDRYGDVPDDAMGLINVAEIRAHAEMVGIESIAIRDRRFILKFAEKNRINAYSLVMAKAEFGDKLVIMSGKVSGLSLFSGKTVETDMLLTLMRILREADENASNDVAI